MTKKFKKSALIGFPLLTFCLPLIVGSVSIGYVPLINGIPVSDQPFIQLEGTLSGVVVEALPNTMFRVECTNSEPAMQLVTAYLSGKMRLHRIRVVPGDRVDVLLDGYSGDKGRIIRRQ